MSRLFHFATCTWFCFFILLVSFFFLLHPGPLIGAEEDPVEYPIFVEILNSHKTDNTFTAYYGIYFFNFPDFDLDSVISITMTGPSGTPVYHYTRSDGDQDDFVRNQFNGFSVNAPGVQAEVGEYTFDLVTDDFSTTVTHVRNENKIIPLADTATMSPADDSIVTSRIPVFEWGSIEDPQMPVYYRLQVYDETGYRIYASGRNANLRSVALPEGLLQPGQTYSWIVSVYDHYDGSRVENASHTQNFSITMADAFTSRNTPPAIDLDGWGAVSWRSNDSDATSLWIKVTDRDGIAYNGSSHQVTATFNGETHPLYLSRSNSAYEAHYEYWDGNTPAPAGTYVFTVTDPDGNTATASDILVVDPLPVPDHNTFETIPDGTSPTFTWEPVAGAQRYQVRISDMNRNTVWNGHPVTTENITYTVPPGVLQPNTRYRYHVRARDNHYPVDIDNSSRSDDIGFTTAEESVKPLIITDLGAATRSADGQGTYLFFWTKIYDAQGVPGDIQSVTATFPDGTTIPLYLEYTESSTCGIYYNDNFGQSIAPGAYTITVQDLAGNTHSITDTLVVNPIGYPNDSSITAVVTDTQVDVTWDAVEGAAFYRLEIFNMDGNRLHNFGTTQNSYTIPAGYLKDNTDYQYRITTWREFFDQENDNSSTSGMLSFRAGITRNILSGENQTLDVTSDTRIIGTGARETIDIPQHTNVSFTAGNGDQINLPYNLSDYTPTSAGNRLFLDDNHGCRVTLTVNGTSTILFADGTAAEVAMLFEPGVPPMVLLGETVIGN